MKALTSIIFYIYEIICVGNLVIMRFMWYIFPLNVALLKLLNNFSEDFIENQNLLREPPSFLAIYFH